MRFGANRVDIAVSQQVFVAIIKHYDVERQLHLVHYNSLHQTPLVFEEFRQIPRGNHGQFVIFSMHFFTFAGFTPICNDSENPERVAIFQES